MTKRKNITLLTTGIIASFYLQSCASSSNEQEKLTLTGSSTVAPLAGEIAKRFEAENPGVRIDVQTGGSSRGLADAREGLADIGMVSRALKPEEEQELHGEVIARDGIGIIVNSANPMENISNEEVIAIYKGEIKNWQELKSKEAPITVVNKAEGRSTLELFLKHFQLENKDIKADVIIGDNQQGIKTVAGNPDAVGYVSIGAAEYEIQQGVPIKLLSLDGVEASTEAVKDDTFPLSRSLTLVTKDKPQGLSQEFIDFAQSQEVYNTVEAQNFIPQK